MSRRYSSEDKSTILERLQDNRGDIALTALQTGVPTRTLYTWQHEERIQRRQRQHATSFLPLQSSLNSPEIAAKEVSTPTFTDDLQAMQFVRSRIMQELLKLTNSLSEDFDGTTPYHRVLILSRLLERLMKLDAHLEPYVPAEKVIRVVYEDEFPKLASWHRQDESQTDPLPDTFPEPSQDVE